MLLIATGGKPYYLAAAYAAPLAAGAVALEALTAGRIRWLRPVFAILAVAGGLLASPLGRPVLPVDRFIDYAAAIGIRSAPEERHEMGRLPQFYADMHGWREMAETVAGVVRSLPERDRAVACVFGQNYGEAGAMEYFAPELGLPPAISAHNSYWLWGPGACTGEVLIVIGDRRERLEELFESVERGAIFNCRDCMPYENDRPIWVARRLRMPIPELWARSETSTSSVTEVVSKQKMASERLGGRGPGEDPAPLRSWGARSRGGRRASGGFEHVTISTASVTRHSPHRRRRGARRC